MICQGNNRNNPQIEENLFQRREPNHDQKRHASPSGSSSNDSYNNHNSAFDHNKSAKIVDYGHGNKPGNTKLLHYKKIKI